MPSLNGGGGAGVAWMVKRPFTVTLNSSLTALLHLSDNVLVINTIFNSLFFILTISLGYIWFKATSQYFYTVSYSSVQSTKLCVDTVISGNVSFSVVLNLQDELDSIFSSIYPLISLPYLRCVMLHDCTTCVTMCIILHNQSFIGCLVDNIVRTLVYWSMIFSSSTCDMAGCH